MATPICSGTIGHRSTERGGNFSRLSTVAADPATISGPPRQPDRVLPDPAARLIDLARAQHGLLTPAQARAAGLRRYAVDVALAGGAVERRAGLLRGRDVTPDDLWRVRVQSALLLAGRDAVTAARPPRGCMVSRALPQSPRSPFWCPRTGIRNVAPASTSAAPTWTQRTALRRRHCRDRRRCGRSWTARAGLSTSSPCACWSPQFDWVSSLSTRCGRDSTHSDRGRAACPPRAGRCPGSISAASHRSRRSLGCAARRPRRALLRPGDRDRRPRATSA